MGAAADGDLDIVQALIDAHADANAKAKNGLTELMIAGTGRPRHVNMSSTLNQGGQYETITIVGDAAVDPPDDKHLYCVAALKASGAKE